MSGSSSSPSPSLPPHHPPTPTDITTWEWDECHILTVTIIGIYILPLCAASIQLGRILYFRHKLLSFHAGFSLLMTIWMLLRVIFFSSLAFPPMPSWVNRVLYWPNTNLQFATYSLLICFFVSYVYRTTWSAYMRRRVSIIYTVSNLVLFAFTIGWIIAAGNRPENLATNTSIVTQVLFTGTVFLLLTIVMAYYGWLYISLMSSNQTKGKNKLLGLPAGGTLLQVKIFYVLALCIFSFRYVYDYTAVNIDFSQEPFGIENKCISSALDFCVLLIWEIVPATLLLLFFRKIPATTARFGRRSKSIQAPLLRQNNSVQPDIYYQPYSGTSFFAAPFAEDDISVLSVPVVTPSAYLSTAYTAVHSPETIVSSNPLGDHAIQTGQLMSYGSSSSSPSPANPPYSQ